MKVFSKKVKSKAASKHKKYSNFEVVLNRRRLKIILEALRIYDEQTYGPPAVRAETNNLITLFSDALNAKL